jgi:hypothetical protein
MAVLCVACASSSALYYQSFSFGLPNENTGVKILDYVYDGIDEAPAWAKSNGNVPQEGGTSGPYRRPRFLYVKWRVIETGRSYEEQVDMNSLLPSDMTGLRVHFAIQRARLLVFLVYEAERMKGGCELPSISKYRCKLLFASTDR